MEDGLYLLDSSDLLLVASSDLMKIILNEDTQEVIVTTTR